MSTRNRKGDGRNLVLETRDTSTLIPDPENTKAHTSSQIDHLMASISAYGFNDPIGITPEGLIVEGHGRHQAAQLLGITEVPCLVLKGFSERDRKLYAIAHNKICMDTSFDYDIVRKELTRIFVDSAGEFNFDQFGISESEFDAAAYVGGVGDTDGAASVAGTTGHNRGNSQQAQAPVLTTYEYLFDNPDDAKLVHKFLNDLTTDANKHLSTTQRFIEHIDKDSKRVLDALARGVTA